MSNGDPLSAVPRFVQVDRQHFNFIVFPHAPIGTIMGARATLRN
jgi:hypothetical protein